MVEHRDSRTDGDPARPPPKQTGEGGPGWRDPAQPWGLDGRGTQDLWGGGVSGPLSIPPQSGCSFQHDGAGSPFPRPTADICLGGPPTPGGGTSSPTSYYASFMGRNFFLCCLVSC